MIYILSALYIVVVYKHLYRINRKEIIDAILYIL